MTTIAPMELAMRYGALMAENAMLLERMQKMQAKDEARRQRQREAAYRRRLTSTLPPINPEHEEPVLPASPPPEPVAEEASPQTSSRAAARDIVRLSEVMPYNTEVYVESLGERITATFTPQGFVATVGGTLFKSPTAICKAHAQRITLIHPRPTKPGSGWDWVKVASTGKSIGETYDAHFAA